MLRLLESKETITRAEVEQLLDVGTATAFRILKHLTDAGMVLQEGKGKNTKYRLI